MENGAQPIKIITRCYKQSLLGLPLLPLFIEHHLTHIQTLNVQNWDIKSYASQFWLAFATFLYVDILDTTGTLYTMARFAGTIDNVSGDFERSTVAYTIDAIGISVGALLGTPPVTCFVESGAGISEGGKTGITAMVTGTCFFFSLFLAPVFASIPPWATGPILVIVGSMMMYSVFSINWKV
jgi:AGZA family xanthine/uracil permease-like MFS transporter